MFEWMGRGKRLEQKLDELLGYYGPRPSAAAKDNYTPPGQRTDPILMTDDREERILAEADEDD